MRNAGCWHWLRVISGVSPSEMSRCWEVIKNSTRKLLSQGKSISTLKKSGFNSITLFLIYSAFTSKELRYYPGSPVSLFYISQGDFASLSLPCYLFFSPGHPKRKARRQNVGMPLHKLCVLINCDYSKQRESNRFNFMLCHCVWQDKTLSMRYNLPGFI